MAVESLIENLVARACPICGNADDSRIFAEQSIDMRRLDQFAFASRKMPEHMHYRLVECPDCDLLYSSPIPQESALEKAYEEASFDSSEEAELASLTYGAFLERIAKSLPDLNGALDIGTGDGAFLKRYLECGFTNVQGIEPSLAPIQAADPAIRPLIRQGLFNVSNYQLHSLSAISCFQTIEHLNDPLAVIKGSYTLLRPGGALFLVGHNRRALSAKIMGMKSPIFDIEHMQLFSPKSLRRMLEIAGFTKIDVFEVVNRYPLHYVVKLLPIPNKLKMDFLPKLRKSALGNAKVSLRLGNIAGVGYRA